MTSEVAAAAVGQNIVMPNDERILSTVSGLELANGSLIEGIRATTVLSYMSKECRSRGLGTRSHSSAPKGLCIRRREGTVKMESKIVEKGKVSNGRKTSSISGLLEDSKC